jgi:hypothetical protein
MPSTYTLGKDYTVNGLTGATDLEVTRSSDRIDVTARGNRVPIKNQVSGLVDLTFSCSVFAKSDTVFEIGKGYTVSLQGTAIPDLICVDANREEPQEGIITYSLTFKQGFASETCNIVEVGPGDFETGGSGGGGGS